MSIVPTTYIAQSSQPSTALVRAVGRPVSRKASETALLMLVDCIRTGFFVVGEQMPTLKELSAQLQISHANTRVALSHLEEHRVVDVRPGKNGGIFVISDAGIPRVLSPLYPPVGPEEVGPLLEGRIIIEREIALLAAQRASTADLGRLRGKLEAFEAVSDDEPDEYVERSLQFHTLTAMIAGNSYLRWTLSELSNAMGFVTTRQGRWLAMGDAGRDADRRRHRTLYDAITAGDLAEIRRVSEEWYEVDLPIMLSVAATDGRSSADEF